MPPVTDEASEEFDSEPKPHGERRRASRGRKESYNCANAELYLAHVVPLCVPSTQHCQNGNKTGSPI